jgi:hypothetical protein
LKNGFTRFRPKELKGFFMALEFNIFLLLLGMGVIGFVLSNWRKLAYLYVLSCVMIVFAGVSPFIFDGLILGRIVSGTDAVGNFVYETISLTTTDISVIVMTLLVVGFGFAALLSFASQSNEITKRNPYHF